MNRKLIIYKVESTKVEDKPITKKEYLKIKCNDHWYTSEEDLAIHGDCPYHDLKYLLMKKKLQDSNTKGGQ
jgi:hypothetical protein